MLEISTWSPPKSLACLKGFRLGSGLIWSLLGHSLLVCLLLPLVSVLGVIWGGHRRHFMVGCPLVAAAVHSCSVQQDRWVVPHLAVRASFLYSKWTCQVSQPVKRTPLWPASWLPALDKTRGSKSVEVQRVWEIYDERLQLMSREDALGLDEALYVVMFYVLG